jgi:3-oxoacyl-(acyl-carrier-protein) synthase
VEAMKDAGLDENNFDHNRAGCILGNGIGGFETTEENIRGPAKGRQELLPWPYQSS